MSAAVALLLIAFGWRTMFVAIGLGVAFLAVYLVYHAFSGLAKFGGYGPIRPIYFTLLAVLDFQGFMAFLLCQAQSSKTSVSQIS